MEKAYSPLLLSLKGQCHEIFLPYFFSWISFPPAPEYPIRTVSNFLKNSRRYSQIKVHHWYQLHRWQICHRYQWHRRKILPPALLVLLIPVANLPPVRCQRHQWQFVTGINDTSGKLQLKSVNCLNLVVAFEDVSSASLSEEFSWKCILMNKKRSWQKLKCRS